MSYERSSDYNGDKGTVECPNCGASHPPAFQPIRCSHSGCAVRGCPLCFRECGCDNRHGLFCDAHLVETEMEGLSDPLTACFACMSENAEEADPLKVEQNIAALIVLDYLRDLITVSPKEEFSRIDLLIIIDQIMSDRGLFTAEALGRFANMEAEVTA